VHPAPSAETAPPPQLGSLLLRLRLSLRGARAPRTPRTDLDNPDTSTPTGSHPDQARGARSTPGSTAAGHSATQEPSGELASWTQEEEEAGAGGERRRKRDGGEGTGGNDRSLLGRRTASRVRSKLPLLALVQVIQMSGVHDRAVCVKPARHRCPHFLRRRSTESSESHRWRRRKNDAAAVKN
jgi:hypothetical protein